ncbi:MAG: hypothetical protein QOK15_2717 [Nocardioidaceae bacterium]|nr:hypothetical protein [Nocardioidaceae bacterium]
MTWERRLFDLFEDLEQQAEALDRAERDAEVAELAVAEYAEVELAARVHASIDAEVELWLTGGELARGRLVRAGADWCLLRDGTASARECLVRLAAVAAARGLAARAVPEPSRRVTARLRLGSVLRSLAEERHPVQVLGVDGQRRQGVVHRVGADFFELVGDTGAWVLPFTGVAALRR